MGFQFFCFIVYSLIKLHHRIMNCQFFLIIHTISPDLSHGCFIWVSQPIYERIVFLSPSFNHKTIDFFRQEISSKGAICSISSLTSSLWTCFSWVCPWEPSFTSRTIVHTKKSFLKATSPNTKRIEMHFIPLRCTFYLLFYIDINKCICGSWTHDITFLL